MATSYTKESFIIVFIITCVLIFTIFIAQLFSFKYYWISTKIDTDKNNDNNNTTNSTYTAILIISIFLINFFVHAMNIFFAANIFGCSSCEKLRNTTQVLYIVLYLATLLFLIQRENQFTSNIKFVEMLFHKILPAIIFVFSCICICLILIASSVDINDNISCNKSEDQCIIFEDNDYKDKISASIWILFSINIIFIAFLFYLYIMPLNENYKQQLELKGEEKVSPATRNRCKTMSSSEIVEDIQLKRLHQKSKLKNSLLIRKLKYELMLFTIVVISTEVQIIINWHFSHTLWMLLAIDSCVVCCCIFLMEDGNRKLLGGLKKTITSSNCWKCCFGKQKKRLPSDSYFANSIRMDNICVNSHPERSNSLNGKCVDKKRLSQLSNSDIYGARVFSSRI